MSSEYVEHLNRKDAMVSSSLESALRNKLPEDKQIKVEISSGKDLHLKLKSITRFSLTHGECEISFFGHVKTISQVQLMLDKKCVVQYYDCSYDLTCHGYHVDESQEAQKLITLKFVVA